jgi:hypothetical protein
MLVRKDVAVGYAPTLERRLLMLRPADLDGWCGLLSVRHSDYDGCGSALDSHQTSPEQRTSVLNCGGTVAR